MIDIIAFKDFIYNAQAFKIYQGTGISSLSSNLAISSFVIQHEILVRTNKNTFGYNVIDSDQKQYTSVIILLACD